MIITVDAVMATRPCPDYPVERVEALVGAGLDPALPATLEAVLALPQDDARRVLSRLMTPANAATWAMGCAERAQGYVANFTTNCVEYAKCVEYSGYATDAARNHHHHNPHTSAARAALYTVISAEYATLVGECGNGVDDEEHRLACQHALSLISEQP